MKKLLYLAIILLGVGVLSSCDKVGGNQNSIVGSWKVVDTGYNDDMYAIGTVWTFEKGGGFLIDGYPYTQWRYDEKEKFYKVGASGWFEVMSITNQRLLINFEGDLIIGFEKVK